MICTNCGGEYQENDLRCPFCGRENEIMAEKRKEQKLHSLDQEAEEIKKLPEKVLKHSTGKMLRYVGMAMGVLLLVLVLILAGSVIVSRLQHNKAQKQLAEIERLYALGDLQAMTVYMDQEDVSGRTAGKYQSIKYAYRDYTFAMESIGQLHQMTEGDYFDQWSADNQKKQIYTDMEWAIRGLIRAVQSIDEITTQYGIYNDLQPVLDLRETCIERFRTEFLFEDARIDELIQLELAENESLVPYIDEIYMQWREVYTP